MITIRASNVNEAYKIGILMLKEQGVKQSSQHGDTLEMPQPVSVMYDNPRERVLFDETRDSNPFLNLFEALWIIQGRNDVEFLKFLVGNMERYSDDGKTYYGAYGFRMRNSDQDIKSMMFEQPMDQLECAIERLKKNPDDRQVVLTIRTAEDMFYKGKDNPCNLMVSCKIRNGKLNIHVFNRSNDFVWGMTGTNVVQFSMLQEYMAGKIGCEVGVYHQTTDSMHVYTNDQWDKVKDVDWGFSDPYIRYEVKPYEMMVCQEDWDDDLSKFFKAFDDGSTPRYNTPFFTEVVEPMWLSFLCYANFRQSKDFAHIADAISALNDCYAEDWGLAASLWLKRRGAKC